MMKDITHSGVLQQITDSLYKHGPKSGEMYAEMVRRVHSCAHRKATTFKRYVEILLLRAPDRSPGFTILGETFAYFFFLSDH